MLTFNYAESMNPALVDFNTLGKVVYCAQSGSLKVSMDAYCLKCKTKRDIRSQAQVTLKNGRKASQGTCPVC